MNDHASLLREAATAIRPMIEDDIDKREIYAAWRKKFSDAGLDWMAFKSLQKARVEDDRDESGDGKRVAKIMDRLDCTAAYADMLGYGQAKMNENNCFSGSYSEAKGSCRRAAFSELHSSDTPDGNAQSEGRQDDVGATASSTNSPDGANETMGGLPVAAASETAEETGRTHAYTRMGMDGTPHRSGVTGGESAAADRDAGHMPTCALTPRDDITVGTNSHSPDTPPVEANSAGEAPSSSRASPATHSDDFDPSRDIPAFMRRTDKGSMAPRGQQIGFTPGKVR